MDFDFFEVTLWDMTCFISFGESRAFRVAILFREPHGEATVRGNHRTSILPNQKATGETNNRSGFLPPAQSRCN